jgi:hypothetical protein
MPEPSPALTQMNLVLRNRDSRFQARAEPGVSSVANYPSDQTVG